MKNKKAILPEATLKIIIAVLCILILIYLAFQLYNLFLKKTALEQARKTLGQIITKLDSLESGENTQYLILNPKEWFLISFNKGENSPESCQGKNCVCICSGVNVLDCETMGVCEPYDTKIRMDGGSVPYWCKSSYNGKDIYIFPVPFNLYIRNENNQILISEFLISETKFLDDLFKKEIDFKGEKSSFEDFVKKNYASFCDKDKFKILLGGIIENAIDRDAKNVIQSESENFVNGLIDSGKIETGQIRFCLMVEDKVDGDKRIEAGNTPDDEILIEEKIICDSGDIVARMRLFYVEK